MIHFTGYGCVNCRKMEAAVWTDSKVGGIINDKYVLISLYVDDKTPLNEPINVVENGTERTLRTVGDKWSYLQRVKFGANAQPFYVLLDNDGNPLNKSYAYNEDIQIYRVPAGRAGAICEMMDFRHSACMFWLIAKVWNEKKNNSFWAFS